MANEEKEEMLRDIEAMFLKLCNPQRRAVMWVAKNIDFLDALLKEGRLVGADLETYLQLGREKKDDYLFMIAGYLQARTQQWMEETGGAAVTPSDGAEPPGR